MRDARRYQLVELLLEHQYAKGGVEGCVASRIEDLTNLSRVACLIGHASTRAGARELIMESDYQFLWCEVVGVLSCIEETEYRLKEFLMGILEGYSSEVNWEQLIEPVGSRINSLEVGAWGLLMDSVYHKVCSGMEEGLR